MSKGAQYAQIMNNDAEQNKRMQKKILAVVITTLLLFPIHPMEGLSARQSKPSRISLLIATGPPGSVDYQVGLGLASLWTSSLRNMGIRVSAAISEGSGENIEAVKIGDADLIMTDEYFCYSAFFGKGPYKDKPQNQIRSIAILWPDLLHILVKSEKAPTSSLQDLEGLTVATGLPDSACRRLMEHLLRENTVTKKDVKLKPLSNIAALEAWKTGAVQAMSFSGGLPIPTVNFFTQQNIGLFGFLEVSNSEIANLRSEAMPNVFGAKIPAGLYSGQDKDVNTVGQHNMLATSALLDRQIVYELTRTIFENIEYLVRIHPVCSNISIEKALTGLKIPLHPGAIQYYREKKMAIPEELSID